MAAVIFAAYLLISQLAEIGFDTIADELRKADAAWVVVALLLAQTDVRPVRHLGTRRRWRRRSRCCPASCSSRRSSSST